MGWRHEDAAWDAKLPPTDKLVLLAYCDRADKNTGQLWGGIKYISRRTGLSRASVQRARARLIDAGYLRVVDERFGYTPIIEVLPYGPGDGKVVDMDAWRAELADSVRMQ